MRFCGNTPPSNTLNDTPHPPLDIQIIRVDSSQGTESIAALPSLSVTSELVGRPRVYGFNEHGSPMCEKDLTKR